MTATALQSMGHSGNMTGGRNRLERFAQCKQYRTNGDSEMVVRCEMLVKACAIRVWRCQSEYSNQCVLLHDEKRSRAGGGVLRAQAVRYDVLQVEACARFQLKVRSSGCRSTYHSPYLALYGQLHASSPLR